jgi:hypothetical protein
LKTGTEWVYRGLVIKILEKNGGWTCRVNEALGGNLLAGWAM